MKARTRNQTIDPAGRDFFTVDGDLNRECLSCGSLLKIKAASTVVATTGGSSPVIITGLIPAKSLVFGVTARVNTILAGTNLGTWGLGVSGTTDLFATGKAVAVGTTVASADHKSTFALSFYNAATDIHITASAGQFDSGQLRVTVFYIETSGPTR